MDSYRDDPSVNPANALPVEGIRARNRLAGNVRIWPNGVSANCGRHLPGIRDLPSCRTNPALGDLCGYYGFPATQQIRNADSNLSGYFYGTYDFTDNLNGVRADQRFAGGREGRLEHAVLVIATDPAFRNGVFFDPTLNTLIDLQRIFTPSEVGGVGSQQTTYRERSIDIAAGLRGTMFDNRFDWEAYPVARTLRP